MKSFWSVLFSITVQANDSVIREWKYILSILYSARVKNMLSEISISICRWDHYILYPLLGPIPLKHSHFLIQVEKIQKLYKDG